ncbi:unnamed protein product [Rotaria sp. Silwood2]|nr:unnamed protein product [Rotaria sp. Silwood2]
MYLADGGKDIQAALDISVNSARNAYAIRYLEKWNKTREITFTGSPIDGIVSPVMALPAYPTGFMISVGYTGIVNFLQLSSVVLPVTRVDLQLDQITDEYRNVDIASNCDQAAKDAYKGPEAFENIIVGLQVICRRLEEEKAIGLAMVLERALQFNRSNE